MLEVTAAVILRKGRLFLATRKPGGHLAGFWEFPGGKVEEGESLSDGIARECREELGLSVLEAQELLSLVHEYPGKTVRLHFMLCRVEGEPEAKEGQSFGWFTFLQAQALDLTPADREALDALVQLSPLQEWRKSGEI